MVERDDLEPEVEEKEPNPLEGDVLSHTGDSVGTLVSSISSGKGLRGDEAARGRCRVGAVYVLYVPGYTLIEALYPKRNELERLERFALGVGLSLAVVPLVGL